MFKPNFKWIVYVLTFTRFFNICSVKFLGERLMLFHIYIWRKLNCYAELLQSQIKIKQIKKMLRTQRINLKMLIYMKRPQATQNLYWTSYLTLWKIFIKEGMFALILWYWSFDKFRIKDAKFPRFYLLPKIHKILYYLLWRPVILNCGYYIENTLFFNFHLQPIAKKVKSFIKDNDFLKKLHSLTNLPDNSLLCTINIVGVYLKYSEWLSALRKRFDERDKIDISTDTLVELTEIVLKTIFLILIRNLWNKKESLQLWQSLLCPIAF